MTNFKVRKLRESIQHFLILNIDMICLAELSQILLLLFGADLPVKNVWVSSFHLMLFYSFILLKKTDSGRLIKSFSEEEFLLKKIV